MGTVKKFQKQFFAVICLCIAILSVSCHGIQGEENLTFRELLTPAEYTKQATKIHKRIPQIKELEASNLPAVGIIVVNSPKPYTQAFKQGIKRGDIIIKNDDVEFNYRDTSWQRKDVPQQLHYVTTKGKKKSFTIQPGMVGVSCITYRRPDLWYTRKGQRSKKWDKHVLLAISTHKTNPRLAETAWFHAFKEGYKPDLLSQWSGAFVAYYQGKPEEAWQHLCKLSDLDNVCTPVKLYSKEKYAIALANGKINYLSKIHKATDDIRAIANRTKKDFKALERLNRRFPLTGESPSQKALKMKRINVIDRSDSFKSSIAPVNVSHSLKNCKFPFIFSQSVGSNKEIAFVPNKPVKDAEFKMEFTIKYYYGRSYWAKIFVVGIIDKNANGPTDSPFLTDSRVLSFCMERDQTNYSKIKIGHSKLPKNIELSEKRIKFNGKQVHTLRMIKVGGAGEIFFDGRRVAYVPLDNDVKELAFFMKVVGMNVSIKKMEVWELK